jgi:hypothetical protein
MNNTEILRMILDILLVINLCLSVYNFYQSRKKTQPQTEKLTCSSLFCSFTGESEQELTEHEKEHKTH